ncbi:MAG TPA: universal stress protein [Bacillota bacterium]|nr:universal stress protein [Bacillota bacterium]
MQQKVLVPIDLARCPLEVFEWVNRLSQQSPMTVILLHVVTLNLLAAENRIYEELGTQVRGSLQRLARTYLRPATSTLIRVRLGQPVEQILAQARADHPDLILLPVQRLGFQKRPALPWHRQSRAIVSGLARKVLRNAACDVLVVPSNAPFDRARDPGGDHQAR